MDQTYNKEILKEKRKILRGNMTEPERKLWQKIRNCQLNGYKFRRQYSIDSFIVDFYCPNKRLAIEIDGDSHYSESGRIKDRERDTVLSGLDIIVLRFTNKEVTENLEGVVEKIANELGENTPSSSPYTRGRGHTPTNFPCFKGRTR